MLSIQDRKNGNVVLGKICVHDRVKVECNVLPRFFAHSSYASFRRQLNYFSFNRIGKGRQLGATYCNDKVIDLEDILSLKRRSVTHNCSNGLATLALASTPTPPDKLERANKGTVKENSVSSLGGGFGGCNDTSKVGSRQISRKKRKVSSNPKRVGKCHRTADCSKIHQTPCIGTTVLLKRVSPPDPFDGEISPPVAKRISLDLTSPDSAFYQGSETFMPSSHVSADSDMEHRDEDVLAGCRALLCFSRGIPSR